MNVHLIIILETRLKPVGHGYVYGNRYYRGMVKTVLFFVKGRTVDSEGGGGLAFFKNRK